MIDHSNMSLNGGQTNTYPFTGDKHIYVVCVHSICVFLYVYFYMCISICVFLYVYFRMCISICVVVCCRLWAIASARRPRFIHVWVLVFTCGFWCFLVRSVWFFVVPCGLLVDCLLGLCWFLVAFLLLPRGSLLPPCCFLLVLWRSQYKPGSPGICVSVYAVNYWAMISYRLFVVVVSELCIGVSLHMPPASTRKFLHVYCKRNRNRMCVCDSNTLNCGGRRISVLVLVAFMDTIFDMFLGSRGVVVLCWQTNTKLDAPTRSLQCQCWSRAIL